MKDRKGQEVFVGDKVLFYWGWFPWKGTAKGRIRMHTITEGKPFLTGDGAWHEHEPGVYFCMDSCVNDWAGKCMKVDEEYIAKYGIPEGIDFFEDEGVAIPITDDVNVYGLSDEEFKKWKEDLNRQQLHLLWGKKK
jgi:hypothetical protein